MLYDLFIGLNKLGILLRKNISFIHVVIILLTKRVIIEVSDLKVVRLNSIISKIISSFLQKFALVVHF